jgi:ATP-dependent helicase/nuclease subunit B
MAQLDLLLANAAVPRCVIVGSSRAETRICRAVEWLRERGATARVLTVGPTLEGAGEVLRAAVSDVGAAFGWERTTLARLGATLAGEALAERGLVPAGRLSLDALLTRIVHELGPAGLGRFADVADRPGLPRALARTLDELRMACIAPEATGDPDLTRLMEKFEAELGAAALADRALVFRFATEALAGADAPAWQGLLLVDVVLGSAAETEFVRALARRTDHTMALFAEGDLRTRRHLEDALGIAAVNIAEQGHASLSLSRLQRGLFSEATEAGAPDEEVEILSAPGESRECVEIARRILREASRGVPFDRMAIVLRAPSQYRAHLVEALRRAAIPAHFARGTVRPDAAGRAFLALLHCAADKLSAKRFAEYLSLSEVPDADAQGAPPPPVPAADRWFPSDEELLPQAIERASEGEAPEVEAAVAVEDPSVPAVVGGTLRAPYRWERLIVDSAVIGGIGRWKSRLSGRRVELERELTLFPAEHGRAIAIRRELADLASLQSFAYPLLEDLASLPASATWGEWIDRLSALATRALRRPERIVAALAELEPMKRVGPVSLGEVRVVLERRLSELTVLPRGRRYGQVLVASVDEVRGYFFDVVFVPGLAERIFPQKVVGDPILPDRAREAVSSSLLTNADRSAAERLALRLSVGAASRKVVFSYPRLDVEQSRPRTPSFYGLEVLRASEGTLPGFDELARRAERVGGARIGWPAPARARDAVDEAEHDLALLESILSQPEDQTVGTARYLLGANAHLARALRTRAQRWQRDWRPVDGLMHVTKGEAREALNAHSLKERSFSPTALQNFAACPYRFVLQAIHRLSPREEPVPIEELNPLQRGSLVHDVQYALYVRLRDQAMLPVTLENRAAASAVLDEVLSEVTRRYADDLAPAIDRVWQDGIDAIAADLREMLRRDAEDEEWTPAYFELAFGLPDGDGRDPASLDDPVDLDIGLKMRGSIDCVEKSRVGTYRATDYKTGKVRATAATKIGGGQTLQPIFYALALEKIFPGARVDGGRLYYCTTTGEFKEVNVPLDDLARDEARAVIKLVDDWVTGGNLPAAPDEGACQYCDYLRVCGPYEELRTRKVKKQNPLKELIALRKRA